MNNMNDLAKSLGHYDWKKLLYSVFVSREIDRLEETELGPAKKVLYQFSARGHDLPQVMLASLLSGEKDVAGGYYRSRPFLLQLGLSIEDAFAAPMAKAGGYSDGRDIGVVSNWPAKSGPVLIPTSGDVGSQYTPTTGYAQAIVYRSKILREPAYDSSIAVTLGGDASVATNGFWSALTMATTLSLPVLFYIEDNGYAISVPSDKQTPGANIAANLASFSNLKIFDGSSSVTAECAKLIWEAVSFVRSQRRPSLLRLKVPRLSGHSGQDTQAYKSKELIEKERASDPLTAAYETLIPHYLTEQEWKEIEHRAQQDVKESLQLALNRAEPDPGSVKRYLFSEFNKDGSVDVQKKGGLLAEGFSFAPSSDQPRVEEARINMLTAIRRTLQHELKVNERVIVFGEDVGPKGGVHAATIGLQEEFGEARVFDTSLSEEGIIGRAVGMAVAGLMPVAEIQFRKYADPATEQLNNCGTMRWRTNNQFAAPIIVRIPGGFAKCGDPWHSVCNEVMWAHAQGWQVALPSNASDAVGLLRSAMRGNDPVIFFEHRALLDAISARRPYPGDDYVLPFGRANFVLSGDEITIVTWGAMVERCEKAAEISRASVDLIDLRTISPWDSQAVLSSLKKTRRCLIVHEDNITAGFGAEISAFLSERAFLDLDAPISRIAVPDIPIPYNIALMNSILPDSEAIAQKIKELISF